MSLTVREHLPDQPPAYDLDLAVPLQDLPREVEGQVVRVDDALDEAQVMRHQRLAVVHDEHALHVQLDAAPALALEQVERRVGRDEEQGLVLERALTLHVDDLEGIRPVVADVLVELVVLGLVDLVP